MIVSGMFVCSSLSHLVEPFCYGVISSCFSHVNAGRLTGLRIGVRYPFSAMRDGVFSPNLITCPSQFSLRLQMVLDQSSAFVLLYSESILNGTINANLIGYISANQRFYSSLS